LKIYLKAEGVNDAGVIAVFVDFLKEGLYEGKFYEIGWFGVDRFLQKVVLKVVKGCL
jgi:hypothetical protein